METLVWSTAMQAALALLLAYVGSRVGQRDVSEDAALAQSMFLTFWFGMALNAAIGVTQKVLYMTDNLTLRIYATLGDVGLLAVMAALMGLLYYLVYVYSGSRRWFGIMLFAYIAFYAYLNYVIGGQTPDRLVDNGWDLRAEPAVEFGGLYLVVILLALVGPQLGAAIALLFLYTKLEARSQKYRVGLLATGLLAWFGLPVLVSIFAQGAAFTETMAWRAFTDILAVAAVATILAGYRPPSWVRRRYGVTAIGD